MNRFHFVRQPPVSEITIKLNVTVRFHDYFLFEPSNIIEANIERTDFTRTITDAFLEGPAGETLPKLVHCIKASEV